jgi:hypothetical protein
MSTHTERRGYCVQPDLAAELASIADVSKDKALADFALISAGRLYLQDG